MYSMRVPFVMLLLLGCTVYDGNCNPFDAIKAFKAFKKGVIAGIFKSQAIQASQQGNRRSGDVSLTTSSVPSSNSNPFQNGNNIKIAGNIDISGMTNDGMGGSLRGNINYESSSTPNNQMTRGYSVEAANAQDTPGRSISRINLYRSRNGFPYGSRDVNVLVSNAGSGIGAIVNINQGITTTDIPVTTTVMSPIDYEYVIPGANEVDYDGTQYDSFTETATLDPTSELTGSSATISTDYDTSTVSDTMDYVSDYPDNVNKDLTISASASANFSVDSSLYSATGTPDHSTRVVDVYTTDIAGNAYEIDNKGYSTSPSPSTRTSKQYEAYMRTNMAAMRELSDLARLFGSRGPLTIRLRSRQRVRSPAQHSASELISSSGTTSNVYPGSVIYEIERAPLLYKYSDVIESTDAIKVISKVNENYGVSPIGSQLENNNFNYPEMTDVPITIDEPIDYNTDVGGSDYVDTSTGVSTDYISSDIDYNNFNFGSSGDVSSINTDIIDGEPSSFLPDRLGDLSPSGTIGMEGFSAGGSASFSTSDTNVDNSGGNTDGSADFSASGTIGINGFDADGSASFSSSHANADNSGFNTDGSADISASATFGIDGLNADDSASFSTGQMNTDNIGFNTDGSTDISGSGAFGIDGTADGSASFSTSHTNTDNGGFNTDGSASIYASHTNVISGGFNTDGSASFSSRHRNADNGGFNADGSASFSSRLRNADNDGFNADGSASFSSRLRNADNGGFNADGSASISASDANVFTGGYNTGGSASVSTSHTNTGNSGFNAGASASFSASSSLGNVFNNYLNSVPTFGRSIISRVNGKEITAVPDTRNSVQRQSHMIASRRRALANHQRRIYQASRRSSTNAAQRQLNVSNNRNVRTQIRNMPTINKANSGRVSNNDRAMLAFLANMAERHRQSRIRTEISSNRRKSIIASQNRRYENSKPRPLVVRKRSAITSLARKENLDISRGRLNYRYSDSISPPLGLSRS